MKIIMTAADEPERAAFLRMLDRVIQDDFETEDGKALDRLRALLAHAEVEHREGTGEDRPEHADGDGWEFVPPNPGDWYCDTCGEWHGANEYRGY